MNKLKSLIVLSLMLFVGGQMMGQTHGTMYLGASFPMGDFAKLDVIYSTALFGNGDQTYGAAGIGFNAGLKWDFGVGVPGLAVLLSVDGLYNGPSADMKECYKDQKGILENLYDDVEVTSPKYINLPFMVGLRYTYYINPDFGIFAEGAAGGNARFITNYTERYTFNEIITGIQINHKNTFDYSTALSFAYQAGLGIEVSKNFVVGCSFYDLGTTPVKGEFTAKTGSESNTTDFEFGKLHPQMILARIGFRF